MNAAQLHLVLNHLPVLIPLIGIIVTSIGLALKSRTVRDVGAWIIVAGAIGAVPAYLSGKYAEGVVKNYPDVSTLIIHDHESAALNSLIALEITGLAMLFFAVASLRKKEIANHTSAWLVLVAIAAGSFGSMAWTAHLGGLIRHEEIRTNDRF